MAVTNPNDKDNTPPEPPPPAPPAPPYPERRPHNNNDLKTCKMAAQRMCADALHDPGGQTNSPGSKPPSVQLEGERIRLMSLYVEVDDAETVDDHTHEPTEPLDEEKGSNQIELKLRTSRESSRVDETDGKGDEGTKMKGEKLKEVENEARDQSEGKGCQRDGRMCDMGSATSGTSHNSK
ncbi:hypothetical protein PAXINDRAFT_17700 [Paxillus involutus ATCC 200175]|uniref:Uncharacterized protein n=1 Tax=Paxillus involutus ATCC 200175 TaxID=664439 RepID=A0A0C9SPT3_PAXIN|nr:hypothetical protein PAXINDRAFT_17700 [Paxillus involutus ATCC 200175]